MNATNLRKYNLTVEQGEEIDKDFIRKEEIEDFIVNTEFFYRFDCIILEMASKLNLNYRRIKVLREERILETQGNPGWVQY